MAAREAGLGMNQAWEKERGSGLGMKWEQLAEIGRTGNEVVER